MLAGTKKLMGNIYDTFVDAMIDAAEDESLPMVMELQESTKFTMHDLYDLMYEFRTDTGLEMTSSSYLCNECGQLHTVITIDYPEDDNDIPIQ